MASSIGLVDAATSSFEITMHLLSLRRCLALLGIIHNGTMHFKFRLLLELFAGKENEDGHCVALCKQPLAVTVLIVLKLDRCHRNGSTPNLRRETEEFLLGESCRLALDQQCEFIGLGSTSSQDGSAGAAYELEHAAPTRCVP
jgi:hypothetical protein